MNIYNTNNVSISSVIRVQSECDEGDKFYYNGFCYDYELIYSLSGKTRVTFQNKTVYDTSGVIRYLPRRIENNIYFVENIKTGECIDILFNTESPMPDIIFTKDYSSNSKIRELFIKIHNVWHKKRIGYYNQCLSLFYAILAEMEKSDSVYMHKSHAEKIKNAVSYIHNHYCDIDFDYLALASECGVSYTYFKKLFSEVYKTTPSQYIKALKIQKACELLSTNKFSVTQIAEMCGYENIYYFSRVFKETTGVSPTDYISRHSL